MTKGEFVVLDIERVDEEKEKIYFTAVGREEGEDPYLVHLYQVDFDLLIIPNNRHGYRGTHGDYFTRKRWDYFVRHLHGIVPPAFSIKGSDRDN